jgi:hypothetical protein
MHDKHASSLFFIHHCMFFSLQCSCLLSHSHVGSSHANNPGVDDELEIQDSAPDRLKMLLLAQKGSEPHCHQAPRLASNSCIIYYCCCCLCLQATLLIHLLFWICSRYGLYETLLQIFSSIDTSFEWHTNNAYPFENNLFEFTRNLLSSIVFSLYSISFSSTHFFYYQPTNLYSCFS